jgi:hypothetical protein
VFPFILLFPLLASLFAIWMATSSRKDIIMLELARCKYRVNYR